MNYEKSCGAVLFTAIHGTTKYLLITSLEGIYGFPKGHMEADETEIETALREIYEETHLKVSLIHDFRTTTEYPLPAKKDTLKKVTYFLGTFKDQEIEYQKEELSGFCLLSYEEALQRIQHADTRRILTEAHEFLMKQNILPCNY